MEGLVIKQRPQLRRPYLLAVWPGMGDVAYKAGMEFVKKLRCRVFAYLNPEDFFSPVYGVVQYGIIDMPRDPDHRFYFWRNPQLKASHDFLKTKTKTKNPAFDILPHDWIIFIGDYQPDFWHVEEYCRRILRLAKLFSVEKIITLASLPQPIDHLRTPRIYFAATNDIIAGQLQKLAFEPVVSAQISGMNGFFLARAKQEGFDGCCLLVEIPLYTIQIDNPRATYTLLKYLSQIFCLNIDLSDIFKQIQKNDEEINKLFEHFKLDLPSWSGGPAPLKEEDIQQIKDGLSNLSLLPSSAKDKIEKLFQLAKDDLSKAKELKEELDKWNAYAEYEDRFLDLFKKKETDNPLKQDDKGDSV